MSRGSERMSSTDSRKLRRWFAKALVPVAKQLRARGVSFFVLAPCPEADSWYEDGVGREPDFAEVEAQDCEHLLREMWEQQGLPELAALAADLMALARDLQTEDEQAADVSPSLYVMY